jgi:integrase
MPRLIRGLWKHANGFWYFSRMRQGVRRTVALETKDEDEAIRRALEVVDSPELAPAGTLEGEIEAFITYKVGRNEYSRFSAENKKLTLKRFARWIGTDTPIPKIDDAEIKRFYNEERKRIVPRTGKPPEESTVQGYMMCLRSFFSWLKKERKSIARNPTVELDMGRWDYGSKTLYCAPEMRDRFLNHWRHIPVTLMDRDQAWEIGFIVHAGFEAGMRRNEIIEARPEWFSLQTNSIRVRKTDTFRPKDRESRSIPLTDVFRAFLEERPMHGTWCIASEKTRGKSRYRYDFSAPFEKYREFLAGGWLGDFSWMTAHIMRHTFGSLLAIAGESLMKISDWMGDDPRVTERHYLHFQEGDKAINRLHSFSPGPQFSKPHTPPSLPASSKRGTRRNRKASAGETLSSQ